MEIKAISSQALPALREAVEKNTRPRSSLDAQARVLSTKHPDANKNSAVINISGHISQFPSFLSILFGGTSCQEISSQIQSALSNKKVKSIILNVSSPGGSVYGVAELASEIRRARKKKPIVAIANSLCASAAYWISSQASKIFVTPGGEIGSVGVLAVHTDLSGYFDRAGVRHTIIKSGKYKAEGNPYQPLDNESKTEIQRGVDRYYNMFISDIAKGRGISASKVISDFGQGRLLSPQEAVKAGMADGIRSFQSLMSDPSGSRRRAIDFTKKRIKIAEMMNNTEELKLLKSKLKTLERS